MDRSPLLLTNDVHFCVSGTVTIHPTAAIATNVVLRANPGSCLVIGAGVVVGEGCVIQSYGGSLVVEEGVTLGSQVLLIGQGVVHRNACVGSLSTLMASIAVGEGEMIPANSLVGAPEPHVESNGLTDTTRVPVAENKAHEVSGNAQDNRGDSAADLSSADHSSSNESKVERSELPHPNSHRMFMPINTPRYSGGAVDNVNEGRELGKSASSNSKSENSGPENSGNPLSSKTNTQTSQAGAPSNRSSSDSEKQEQQNSQEEEKEGSIENANGSRGLNKPSKPPIIYGKSSVQRLMTMMFPYRTLNSPGDDKE